MESLLRKMDRIGQEASVSSISMSQTGSARSRCLFCGEAINAAQQHKKVSWTTPDGRGFGWVHKGCFEDAMAGRIDAKRAVVQNAER